MSDTDTDTGTTRSLDIADISGLPVPGPHTRHLDGDYHRGLQDAPHYDLDGIDPTQPLIVDIELAEGAGRDLQAWLHQLLGAIAIQSDICKDRRAQHAAARQRLSDAAADNASDEKDAEDAVAVLPGGRPDLRAAALPGSPPPTPPRRRRWPAVALLLGVLAPLEIVANYLALQYLRDDIWATLALAAAASVTILTGCTLLARVSGRPAAAVALGVTVAAVVVGSGIMRYRYAVDAINTGLADQGVGPIGTGTRVGVLLFALGLPAALGLIAFHEARTDPATEERMATRTDEVALITGVQLLRERVRSSRIDLQDALAAETAASDARSNAETALRWLCDQSDAVITAELARRVERLAAYYRGLAHQAANPALTARLDRRYEQAVDHMRQVVQAQVEDARKLISTIRNELPTFPAPETPGREQTR